MVAIIIILVLIVLAVLFVIFIYNKLVRLRTMVEEGWSGIDVQLKNYGHISISVLS